MSFSSLHAAEFYRDVVRTRVLWTIRDSQGFPAPIGNLGQRAMPFWSTESRARRIINQVPTYANFKPFAIDLGTFRERWIPGLIRDELLVGINWSGTRATGYDISPEDLQRSLDHLLSDLSDSESGDT